MPPPMTPLEIVRDIIHRAWNDETFKARLLARPDETLRGQGLHVADGVVCTVVEDTPSLRHIVLPARPSRLSDDELDRVAGGAGDVQLSPNVTNAFKQINEAGALQFDVPNYVQQNMPLPDIYPTVWYDGSMGGSPGMVR